MSTVSVNARLFRVVHNFISTEETRHYLNGVHIEKHARGGLLMVATDGHRLMCVHDEKGSIEGDSVIVKLDKAALAACKAGRGEPDDRRLKLEGNNVTVQNCHDLPVGAAFNVVIDGTFPAWRRVIPNLDAIKPRPAAFNGEYLADYGKASGELRNEKSSLISLWGDGDGANIVRFPNVNWAFGLLMPCRFDHERGLPDFLKDSEALPDHSQSAAA